jgi:hypothetical protein
MSYNLGNFDDVFRKQQPINFNGYDAKTPFNNKKFVNQNDIRHNNLDTNLLNRTIKEYSIIIDSKDRNYQVYEDPFCYDVKFTSTPTKREIINGKSVIIEDPAPTIGGSFKNVKYIKLQEMILPFYTGVRYEIEESEDGEKKGDWKVNVDKPLTDNFYVVLTLGDYPSDSFKSTNDLLSESFAVIYFDSRMNNTHYFGFTANGNKVYPDDHLGKIDRLRINFMDPYGNPIRCEHLDKRIQSNMECRCEDPTGDDNTDCFKHNLFHPLNPIFQHHLHFKVGVVESNLNKLDFS